jgi:archaellum component FlaG (FlaF/FlaG flagellin family)
MGNGMMGVSELVSTVVLIVVVMAIGAFVSPWAFNLVRTSANQTTSNTDMQLLCQNVGYDFDNNYGTNGLVWNLTGANTTLKAKVVNTGTINVYNFMFDIVINNSLIYEVDVNTTSQKTPASPLKPGQSAILVMNTTTDYNDTLTEVTIRNSVCPSRYLTRKI